MKEVIINFKEVYKLPLKNTEGVVFSSNNVWAFTLSAKMSNEQQLKFVESLNKGIKIPKLKSRLKYNSNGAEIQFLNKDETPILFLTIRGWGYLTGGRGGLNLRPEIAINIQKEFAKWIVNTVS